MNEKRYGNVELSILWSLSVFPVLPFFLLVLRYIVSFGSVACVQNADDKIVWMRATDDFFLFFFSFDLFRTPIRKVPRNWVPRGAYKFLCWAIIKFARAYLLLHLLCACTACFNVVDNGQLNLGERIRGVRPMNPKRFRSLCRKCYCERISNFLNY